MSFLRSIRQFHILTRILFLPSAVVIVCAALHLAQEVDRFIHFVRNWKIVLIASLWIMILHTSLELKTAIEDYIPDQNNRRLAIKALIGLGCITALILGLTIGRM